MSDVMMRRQELLSSGNQPQIAAFLIALRAKASRGSTSPMQKRCSSADRP